jgi:stress-induced morphogen
LREAMIDNDSMTTLIRRTMPDADVHIVDLTGTMDHFNVLVRSGAFRGVSLMDRHRMVEAALADARSDGRIHAMSIRTEILE